MRSVMLAAVHNGELRNSPAWTVARELEMEGTVQEIIEVFEQPNVTEIPDVEALVRWRREQRQLEARWRRYLGQASDLRNGLARAGDQLFALRLFINRGFRAKRWRSRQIEEFVTAKHIESCRRFLESRHDFLIVVESDAAVPDNGLDGVRRALTELPTKPGAYLNLAGGLDHSNLGIETLIVERPFGLVSFVPAVTNTSCAYALNKELAADLGAFLEAEPEARALGIDWLFNTFFLSQAETQPRLVCFHADPPALLHGSIEGFTQSWHPDR